MESKLLWELVDTADARANSGIQRISRELGETISHGPNQVVNWEVSCSGNYRNNLPHFGKCLNKIIASVGVERICNKLLQEEREISVR